MSRLEEIYKGWKNYIFKNEEVETLAKKRMKICVECPKLLNNNRCGVCMCYMPAKVRSENSKCPQSKW